VAGGDLAMLGRSLIPDSERFAAPLLERIGVRGRVQLVLWASMTIVFAVALVSFFSAPLMDVDVAISAGESISDLLLQMKQKALSASDTTLDTNSRVALNDDFKSLRDQITKVVNNADFNGVNMVKSGGTTVYALANDSGSTKMTVAAEDLSLGGPNISLTAAASFNSASSASAYIGIIDSDVASVNTTLTKLGTGSNALAAHLKFVKNLQDSLTTGISNLVDADMASESAQLQALQTKQQLGVQALSIANQSTSIMLSLFR